MASLVSVTCKGSLGTMSYEVLAQAQVGEDAAEQVNKAIEKLKSQLSKSQK